MIVYFIKVVAFQLLFLLGYDLFLKKETFFNWNRVYLIFSSVISFVLPFIKIESFQNVVPQEYIVLLPEIVLTPQKAVENIEPTWNWFLIIGIGVSALLFFYKIAQLLQLRFKGRFVKHENYTLVIIPKNRLAFSIFNYVFIGEQVEEAKLQDILSHELVHIREKHSLDLLYFELLRILCWFNPLVYIYQKRISELHEYIADAAVVQHKDKSDYYEKLLAEVFQTQQFSFTNQFFKKSLIKKRIIMLTKQKSRKILKLKYLVLVPILIVSLLYTSCEDRVVADSESALEVSSKDAKQKLKEAIDAKNAFSQSLADVKVMTKGQYAKSQELSMEVFIAMQEVATANGETPEALPEMRDYESYIKAREKNMAKEASYNEFETEAVEFKSIDKAPVFPGCEKEGTLEGIKKCLSQNIAIHVNKNFNMKLADELGLKGKQRIFTKFVIDKNGRVSAINVRAPHPTLVTEVERVLNKLPVLEPGMKDGKPVSVKYVLPITFMINE